MAAGLRTKESNPVAKHRSKDQFFPAHVVYHSSAQWFFQLDGALRVTMLFKSYTHGRSAEIQHGELEIAPSFMDFPMDFANFSSRDFH